MLCCNDTECIQDFIDTYSSVKPEKANTKEIENAIKLNKGGFLFETKIGNVQFGMPPETVKDSIMQGLKVPTTFIIPKQRFDKVTGISTAEFEFPAYFNFFVLRSKIRLVADKDAEKAIRTIFQETLLGPLNYDHFDKDFRHDYPEDQKPKIRIELDDINVNPFNPKFKLTLDEIIEIISYNENGEADLGDGVILKRLNNNFTLMEDDKVISKWRDSITIDEKNFKTMQWVEDEIALIKQENKIDIGLEDSGPLEFNPPDFGVTVLGAGHGFDASGSTSGYIFWLDGRGVMVDPPPFSSDALRKYGIPPDLINKIIITHCHADHDAGAFHKILSAFKIDFITTPTIMQSFVRKYSAVANMAEKELLSQFEFRPVTIGEPLEICGAKFHFFYSFHLIPCIGFECEYKGKKIYFSGDTYYEPEALLKKYEKGVFGKARYEFLAKKDWKQYEQILHEAGVPPVHTSVKTLAALPDDIKKKIRVVHTSQKDITPDLGLVRAKPGIGSTIILWPRSDNNSLMKNMDLICDMDLFAHMNLSRLRDLMTVIKEKTYKKGDIICEKNQKGYNFYIVKSGIVKIYNDEVDSTWVKYYNIGNYFGEGAILGDVCLANVVAYTDCTLLTQDVYNFTWIFGPVNLQNYKTKVVKHQNELRSKKFTF